jgi:hypothetical protein
MKKFLTSRWGTLCAFVTLVVIAKLTGWYELAALPIVFGTVDTAAGHPDYTQDGLNKNIPYAFSRKTLVKFYDSSVIPAISNTDYEGDIKNMGDKVIITTLPDVNISPYQKGMNVVWEDLESDAVTMTMDRAKYWAFKMDKIDIKQFTNKKYMDEAAGDAAMQMKISVDTEFIGDVSGGTTGTAGGTASDASTDNIGATAGRKSSAINLGAANPNGVQLTKTNILDKLIDMGVVADEQNWPESDRWIVLPAIFIGLLKQSDIKDASMTGDAVSTLRNGRIGMIDRWTIYSSNLYTTISDTQTFYPVIFGHRSAIAFATQLTETEFFDKLETTFGKGMKGLQVYDWKTVKPESLGILYAYK